MVHGKKPHLFLAQMLQSSVVYNGILHSIAKTMTFRVQSGIGLFFFNAIMMHAHFVSK